MGMCGKTQMYREIQITKHEIIRSYDRTKAHLFITDLKHPNNHCYPVYGKCYTPASYSINQHYEIKSIIISLAACCRCYGYGANQKAGAPTAPSASSRGTNTATAPSGS
jgi:hypothetical protein